MDYMKYLRPEMMPHILCPGCGHGTVLKAILRAIERLDLPRERTVFVSGIGCSSRIVGYVDFCSLHTTHGRPLTFATGLKLARPDLHVIVITGDGDGLAIGGNHLIHAARRNIDLTCLLLNNATYGMTGGQGAPTTPAGARATTGRTVEPAFDACRLALGAGATFVGRGMTSLPLGLDDLIAGAVAHKGFAFVEILSDCPEFFGRYNHLGKGPEMLQAQRRHTEGVERTLAAKRFVPAYQPAPAPDEPVVPAGVLHREDRPEFTVQLAALVAAAARRPAVPPAPASAAAADADQVPPGAPEYHVRLAGAGGQGIVLAGLLLAEAAVAAGRNATHAQAYGPESRGGATKAEVIIADGDIDYPYADRVDCLLALTPKAYQKYVGQLVPGGLLVVDEERVPVTPPAGVVCHALPIQATAQRVLGTPVGANVVALGALVALSGCVPLAAVERAVATRRPGGTAEPGLRALRAGAELARPAVALAGA